MMNLFRAFRRQVATSVATKIILMVAGSLALLLALGFADPNNTQLMPAFISSDHFASAGLEGSPDRESITRAIAAFNRDLARAYLDLDTAALAAVPLDDRLRKNYYDEIAFLQNDGRVLELTAGDVSLTKLTGLPNDMLSVDTVEAVSVRYLNAKDRTEIAAYPEAHYAMNYTLNRAASGWKIVQITTLDTGKRDE